MAGLHFNGFLPERVVFLEDDLIGTSSGNPSSEVVYGFRKDIVDEAPHFAVVNIVPRALSVLSPKMFQGIGPLLESEYVSAMEELNADVDKAWKKMQELIDGNLYSANPTEVVVAIPRNRSAEFIIGHTLEAILS